MVKMCRLNISNLAALWVYLRVNNLLDPRDKRYFFPDWFLKGS